MLNLLCTLLLSAASLKVGDVAPDFSAVDALGNTHTLQQLLQNGAVILAFYPKAFTPGCTQEITTLGKRYGELKALGAQVVAVSGDDAETLKRFSTSTKAAFLFVPDTQAQLMEQYHVRMWPLKMAKRTTFVIKAPPVTGAAAGAARQAKIVRIDSGDTAVAADGIVDFVLHP